MERLKNKVLNLNLKKSFVVLVIVGAIFGVGSGIALHQKFGDRILQIEEYDKQQKEEWLQSLEQYNREAGEQSQVLEWEWHDHDDYYGDWDYEHLDNEWEQMLNISTGDKVLLGLLSGIGLLLCAVYWLLCMVWAYQKADRMGSNKELWTIATFFLNFWVILVMYGYSFVNGTCKNCGRLKKRNEKYCSHCGAAYQQECRHCHASLQKDSNFCPNCGKAMKEVVSDNGQK